MFQDRYRAGEKIYFVVIADKNIRLIGLKRTIEYSVLLYSQYNLMSENNNNKYRDNNHYNYNNNNNNANI